jgi:hypothetical protein
MLLLGAVVLAGCSFGRNYVDDTAREVSQGAFNGKYDDKPIVFVTNMQGEYVFATQELKLHGAWVWAPHIYLEGVIAHEMIHHDMYQRGVYDPKAPHNKTFMKERRLVADKLGLPLWTIPNGKEETWMDGQRTIAYCEALIEIARHRFPVNVYSAVEAPIADIDPYAADDEQ